MFKGMVMTAESGLCWTCKTSWFHSGEDSWYGFLGYDTLWSDGWAPVLLKGHNCLHFHGTKWRCLVPMCQTAQCQLRT